jgi:hypothetical protein
LRHKRNSTEDNEDNRGCLKKIEQNFVICVTC